MDAEVVGKKAIKARAREASTNNIQSTFSGLLQSPIKPAALPTIGLIHSLSTVIIQTATTDKPILS